MTCRKGRFANPTPARPSDPGPSLILSHRNPLSPTLNPKALQRLPNAFLKPLILSLSKAQSAILPIATSRPLLLPYPHEQNICPNLLTHPIPTHNLAPQQLRCSITCNPIFLRIFSENKYESPKPPFSCLKHYIMSAKSPYSFSKKSHS